MTFHSAFAVSAWPYISRSTVKKRSNSEPLPGVPETVYVSGAPFRPRTMMVFPAEAIALHTKPSKFLVLLEARIIDPLKK